MKVYGPYNSRPLSEFLDRMYEQGKLFDLWHVVYSPNNAHCIFDNEQEARATFKSIFDENASMGDNAVWTTENDVTIHGDSFQYNIRIYPHTPEYDARWLRRNGFGPRSGGEWPGNSYKGVKSNG